MKNIKKILVVSPNYPIQGNPGYVFVQTLCHEFARMGCTLTIFAPQSLTTLLTSYKNRRPYIRSEIINGNKISIYQPYTIAFPFRFTRLYYYSMRKAAMRFFKKTKVEVDVCYCHFYRSAYVVLPYVKKYKIPLFVATGEGALSYWKDLLRRSKYMEINKYLNGIISVSSNNKSLSEEIGISKGVDCIVAPNGINEELFHLKNREELRAKYGINQDIFIVAFVGLFTERKGHKRLATAIDKIGNVFSFFIGYSLNNGEDGPNCEGILFRGKLSHDVLPDYLNMADIFVLPSLNEGCSNAIIEALACGLPIVSSNLPFNYDVLNGDNSILIDPNNINEIAQAICTLKEDEELRRKLSEGALRTASQLTIERRAKRILDFMSMKS